MGQTFNATNSGSGTAVMDALLENTNTLRSSFSGASSPSSPVAGQLYFDSTNKILYVYGDLDGGGATWHKVVTDYYTGNLELTDNQLLNARIENLGSDEAASAGTVGKLWINTAAGRVAIVRTASAIAYLMAGNPTEFIPIDLPAGAWDRDATNPPTAVTVGTTPTVRGWLFDATNEKASIHVRVPDGIASATNLKVRIRCALNAAETASDTIDATLDYVAITPNNNEALTKTSTQVTASHDIGANTTQYAVHQFDFTLVYNDASNPIAGGDSLILEFALSSVASVAGIIFLGAELLTPFGGTTLDT